jgi:hypothetical protein
MNEAMKACPSCGATAATSAKFCGHCGHSMVVPEQADPKVTELDVPVTSLPSPTESGAALKQTHFGVPHLDPAEALKIYEAGLEAATAGSAPIAPPSPATAETSAPVVAPAAGAPAAVASAANDHGAFDALVASAVEAPKRAPSPTPPTPFVDRDAAIGTPPTPFVDRESDAGAIDDASSSTPGDAPSVQESAASAPSGGTPATPFVDREASGGTPPTPFVDRDESGAAPVADRRSELKSTSIDARMVAATPIAAPSETPPATPPTPFVDREVPVLERPALDPMRGGPAGPSNGSASPIVERGSPAALSHAALDRAAESVPPPYAISSSAPPGEPTTMDDLPRRNVPKGRGDKRFAFTDMGIGKPKADESPIEAPSARANPRAAADPSKRTMLGMPDKPIERAPEAPAPATEAPRKPVPSTDRTMLGMPAVSRSSTPPPNAPAANRPSSNAPSSNAPSSNDGAAANALAQPQRTMLGMGAAPRTEPVAQRRQRVAVEYHDAAPERASKRPSRALPIAAILFATLLLLAAGAAIAYFAVGEEGPVVRASVLSSAAGETIRIEVPGAPDGTRVRFQGQEAPIAAGRAELALAPDSLHIGENLFALDVVSPDGTARSIDVSLRVSYRVRADLSAVSSDPPIARVLVDAPGARSVTVDGEAIELDANGAAIREIPLDAGSALVERNIAYRIEMPNEPASEGTLRIRVPVATLQLDRPGRDVVTDRESVEIAGAVHANARVSIDGASVPVTEGRFVQRFALPEVRTYEPRIVASEAGKAPHALSIRIRRVADLAAEARSFEADPELDYARLQQNPAIYRGQNIAIEGRVYNVTVSEGRTVLQMLARECPSGQRCPLWVTYPAATDITADEWVRVLGTVAGEQQFRSESNRVLTVPRVDATFVLPAEDDRRRR